MDNFGSMIGNALNNIRYTVAQRLAPAASGFESAASQAVQNFSNAVGGVSNFVTNNPIGQFARQTDPGQLGEKLGGVLSLVDPYTQSVLQKSQQMEQDNNNKLLSLTKNAPTPQLRSQASQLYQQPSATSDYYNNTFNYTPGSVVKNAIGTLGTITKPGQALLGAPIGMGFQAASNLLSGKPIGNNMISGAAGGFNMGAELAPIQGVTDPVLGALIPDVEIQGGGKLMNYLASLPKAGIMGGVPMAALNKAIGEDPLQGFVQGAAFSMGGKVAMDSLGQVMNMPKSIFAFNYRKYINPQASQQEVDTAAKDYVRYAVRDLWGRFRKSFNPAGGNNPPGKGEPPDIQFKDMGNGKQVRIGETPDWVKKLHDAMGIPNDINTEGGFARIPGKPSKSSVAEESPKGVGGGGIEKYVWMANKEGGQTIGNKSIIKTPSLDDFVKEILPRTRKGFYGTGTVEQQYKAMLKKTPDIKIEFFDSGDGWQVGKIDSYKNIKEGPHGVANGIKNGWAKQVEDFNSPEATKHRSIFDSEVVSTPPPLNQGANNLPPIGTELSGVPNIENPQSVVPATTKTAEPVQSTVPPQAPGGGQQSSSSNGSLPQDPVQKIISALQGAKPIRNQQEAIYSKVRSQQSGALAGIGSQMQGEAGFYKKLGQLKGEMPKVSFESIKNQFSQPELDALYNKIESSNLTPFEKVTAQGGLTKLLGAEGGTIPNNSELSLLNEIFPKEFTDAVLSHRTLTQKLFANVQDALNIPRAVMATADMSAPLRQGAFLIGRPKQWLPAFGSMFKYAFSPKAYEGLAEDIQSRPTYQLMRENKLAITNTKSILNQREETFMSNIVDRIPGFGAITQASERAYSGFLNKLRADTFDSLINDAKAQGLDVNQIAPSAARFVNSATGRGELPGSLQNASVALSGLMFSPRLLASRINLMNPMYYASLDPFVRKEALKSLATFAGTALTTLTLAKMSGAEVGADPRSADFGKIKVGDTRYDILAGFQQPIRLMAQLISGHIISSTTGKDITLGQGYKPMTRKDIVMNFLQSKESPVVGFAMGLLQGTDNVGQPFNVGPQIAQRFIPMVAQDMYDLAKDRNSPLAMLMGVPGIFGVGVQTYGKEVPSFSTTPTGKASIQLSPVNGLAEDIVSKITGQPQSNIPQDQWQGIVDAKQKSAQNAVNLDKVKQQMQSGKPVDNAVATPATFSIKGTKQSGQIVGKNFVYIDENGDIQTPTVKSLQAQEQSYQRDINNANYALLSDRAKSTNDYPTWDYLTQQHLVDLVKEQQSLDPIADKAKILTLQKQIDDTAKQMAAFRVQGGFKKASAGKKISVPKSRAISLGRAKLPSFKPSFGKSKAIRTVSPKAVPIKALPINTRTLSKAAINKLSMPKGRVGTRANMKSETPGRLASINRNSPLYI